MEAGVFLRPGDVDIERLIRYADPRAISSDDLRSLEREHEKLAAKCQRPIPMESRVKRTFRQWDSSELRTQWKIQAAGPEEAELAAEFAEYGITNDENWHQIINTRHGWLTPGDWVLCFNCVAAQQSFFWMYVDHVVSVDPDSKAFESGYGDQAVQIGPENVYNDPPFKLSPKTRTWIFKAIEEMGPEKLDNCADITAPPELIEAIRQYL